jgi:hypothetical protein
MRISTGERMVLRDQRICFKIRDIYHAEPTQVLIGLHSSDTLLGQVIDLSDSGLQKDSFIAVKVEAIEEPLIVPAERILRIL